MTVAIAVMQGDSGFVVLREGKPVLHSEPLQHHFDCPLQFGHPAFGTLTDWADNANVYTLELKAGDVVITGSDGLWDNVFLEELLQLLPRAAAEVLRQDYHCGHRLLNCNVCTA